ncbi:MAG: HNH endonuclease [Chloroflexi bacterium]|nr:HNH endonuclease [Chloroflexota bacterium]
MQSKTEPPNLPEVKEFNGRRYVRDTATAIGLKEIYGNSCQVCGCGVATFESILNDNRGYAEVHHIRPLGSGHQGPDYPANMLVLCPNDHAYFDLGTMALNPASLEVYCLELDGAVHKKGPLFLHESGHELDFDCLQYSWNLWLRKLAENGLDISEAQPD